MAFTLDARGFFTLAQAFGPEGVRFAFDATEGAVRLATESCYGKVVSCLRSKWPRSRIAQEVARRVHVTGRAIIGLVTIIHDWVEVLALGKRVPPHPIVARGRAMVIPLAKKRDPGEAINPVRIARGQYAGQMGILRQRVRHPGYRGADCVTPAVKFGERLLSRTIERAALKLAQRLARIGR